MKKLTRGEIAAVKSLVCTKAGAINEVYGYSALLYAGAILQGRKVHYRRAGGPRKRSTMEHAATVAPKIVSAMGYEVEHGNDAPRGGELGDYWVKKGRAVLKTENLPRARTQGYFEALMPAMGLAELLDEA